MGKDIHDVSGPEVCTGKYSIFLPNGFGGPRVSLFLHCSDNQRLYSVGETEESLENMRKSLLSDVKKKNNREAVKMKMEKTFAYRRHEVVQNAPMVDDFMTRWPVLFEVTEVNAEFKRITTIPLQSKFMSQLDVYSEKLLKMFQGRGGELGRRLKSVMAPICDGDLDVRRACILKAVCVYLGEDSDNLVKEYVGLDETSKTAIEETTVGIYVIKDHAASVEPEDTGIVVEGVKVLWDLENVAFAVTMLFGLMYAMNLSYPVELRYTFEVFQKIFMEMNGDKLSNKALSFKNRLFQ
ncbi:hypothetical protein DPEC_G00291960 [Dallia pectoralis]|uniref:Uncharacterized protein n=1 Tax=Dallia pectoralis TaxID=75939 RepID=A0ACC2FHX4_DALPE|nr:hypothetical protein DPEC_G00291960 [Dallia pectoralis]